MYYIIVNPASKSGQGAKLWSVVEPALIQKDIEYKVFLSKEAGHVVKLVRDLSASVLKNGTEIILKLIVLGGDGTLNEVLQGISDFSRVQIGYIPTGSSNDMARDLMLPRDPLKILDNILSCCQPRLMDLGYLSCEQAPSLRHESSPFKRYFAVSCGIGFDAAVCQEALTSRFKEILNKIGLGKLTYLGIALKQLILARKVICTVILDDGEPIYLPKFLFVASMVHRYEGGGFKFCPTADYTDGLIDVCVIGNIPKILALVALPTAFKGTHYRFKGISHYTASKVRVISSDPLWVHTDGEVYIKSYDITLTCRQQQLQFLL